MTDPLFIAPGDMNMTPNQLRELQDAFNALADGEAWQHKIVVLPPGSKIYRPLAGPRTFTGWRPVPPPEYQVKGITNSGESPDYEGVIFTDGTVVIRWRTAFQSHSVWSCWSDFYHVHGHPEYGTRIEWHDGLPGPEESD